MTLKCLGTCGQVVTHKRLCVCAQIGVYNEQSLQRLDLILSEAANNNVYIILPFVNCLGDLGGMQWYVDQVSNRHDITTRTCSTPG